MSALRDWWRRVTGAPEETRVPPPQDVKRSTPGPAPGTLELVEPPGQRRPSRVGAAGFDPYSSDAGYSKPHSWERVDHD